MDREKYIFDGLERHYEEFKKYYPDKTLFYLAIQGSQNYDLDIYTDEYKSDIDTKAIVIPSLEEIVMNKKPISTTHVLPNNEHLDIKDIRLMFDNFKKQNINFLEILFSKYWIAGDGFDDLVYELRKNKEIIAHYNTNQALRCMAGMSMEKKKALTHPYPTIIDKIEKYGYDGKQLHHIIRMYNFITCYALNGTFEESLTFFIPGQKEEMMNAKLNKYSLEEALKKAENYDYLTKYIKDINLKEKDEINQDAVNILYEIQYEAIKRNLKEESQNGE